MDDAEVKRLAGLVAEGEVPPAELVRAVRAAAVADLGYARLDLDRAERTGAGEVIYGAGKTAEQIAGIVRALTGAGQQRVLITRLDAEKAREVHGLLDVEKAEEPRDPLEAKKAEGAPRRLGAPSTISFDHRADARLAIVGGLPEPTGEGAVVVACAGTSDLPVAEEASLTAEFLGNRVERLYDVGVAGLHRLLAHSEELRRARVVVAVAGMEGALPSVIAGLVPCPVIAVPTSVGYGASLGGVAALLAMLNSCASGVSVVNIDNGFGAAFQASLINHPVR